MSAALCTPPCFVLFSLILQKSEYRTLEPTALGKRLRNLFLAPLPLAFLGFKVLAAGPGPDSVGV